jgi:hypothetical protein
LLLLGLLPLLLLLLLLLLAALGWGWLPAACSITSSSSSFGSSSRLLCPAPLLGGLLDNLYPTLQHQD